jgi:hypothetical protein
MKQNTKNKVKGGLLALLMAVGVAKGFAEEKTGTVIMKRDSPPNSSGGIRTSVFMDTDGNKIPDTVLYLNGTNILMFTMLLDEYIQRGSEVVFDDTKSGKSNGLSALGTDSLISIDGISVWDMFPDAKDTWFPYAPRNRLSNTR